MLRHDQMPPIPETPRPLPDGPLYFVGIGGAGMSALAQVLAERGRRVSGADPGIQPAVRERLERAGVTVYTQHDAAQVGDAAVVVVSDAIPEANPEVNAARERGIPIFRRPEVLGHIVNAGRGIAIAGTHGKTTTTGMVASILLAAGLDPTILIGGDLPAIGGNARNGKGEWVVAESCEAYDGFLYLHPEVAVVLNIEADHLDYHGTEEHVFDSFRRFIRQAIAGDPVENAVVLCADDKGAMALLDASGRSVVTYGTGDRTDVSASDLRVVPGSGTSFVLGRGPANARKTYGHVTLQVPGEHNVQNALAAATAAFEIGIVPETIKAGLESFTGTGRRFERIGEAGGVLIVDDYAHHPTELRATLAAARAAYPDRRLVAVFQPHLPSRTRDNMDAFADALTAADAVYLTDIYLAREQPLPGITSEVLADRTRAAKPSLPVTHVPDKKDLPARLAADVRPGDIVLTLGAGDIRAAGVGLMAALTPGLSPRLGRGEQDRESAIAESPAASGTPLPSLGEGPGVRAADGENTSNAS
jgi:UDP-N-acetylmuramate--alanine ligase